MAIQLIDVCLFHLCHNLLGLGKCTYLLLIVYMWETAGGGRRVITGDSRMVVFQVAFD